MGHLWVMTLSLCSTLLLLGWAHNWSTANTWTMNEISVSYAARYMRALDIIVLVSVLHRNRLNSWLLHTHTHTHTSTSASLTTLKPLIVWITTNCGKILKEMGIPDHLTCLLRNLHAGLEATVRISHGTKDWFKTGKWIHQGCISSLCLFKLYVEYIMWNARWINHKLESRLPEEISAT